jgi:porin
VSRDQSTFSAPDTPRVIQLICVAATGLFLALLCAAQVRGQEVSPATQSSTEPETTEPSAAVETEVQVSRAAANEAPDSIGHNLTDTENQRPGIFKYGLVTVIAPYWQELRQKLNAYGIDVGFNFTAVYQSATAGEGDRQAAGGVFDLYGTWRLLGGANDSTTGFLYIDSQYRDKLFTDITPNQLSSQIGSQWQTTNSFNQQPPALREIYWQQQFGGDALIVRAGKINPTNYYNSNYWRSDRKYFMNQAFSASPATAFPQNGLGVNATIKPADWMYFSAGTQDALGQNDGSDLATFRADQAFFSAGELGFTPEIPGLGKGTYRFTGWYLEAVPDEDRPHDAGFDLSFDQHVGPNLIPFIRYGFSEGYVAKVDQIVAGGVGWQGQILTKSDVVGIGGSWGEPSDRTLRDQEAAEVFYRLQLSPDNQVTVGYQVIIDPASNPTQNVVGVLELRWRISL